MSSCGCCNVTLCSFCLMLPTSPSGSALHPTQPVTCSIEVLLQGFYPLHCIGVQI